MNVGYMYRYRVYVSSLIVFNMTKYDMELTVNTIKEESQNARYLRLAVTDSFLRLVCLLSSSEQFQGNK